MPHTQKTISQELEALIKGFVGEPLNKETLDKLIKEVKALFDNHINVLKKQVRVPSDLDFLSLGVIREKDSDAIRLVNDNLATSLYINGLCTDPMELIRIHKSKASTYSIGGISYSFRDSDKTLVKLINNIDTL
jgi:hypothetical protein